jgi:thiamine-monophosphate kinase
MLKLARASGTALVGGNMSGSPVVFIDVAVLGKIGHPQGKYLTRSSSEPGDIIAVTGWLGTSAAGLEMLKKKLHFNAATTDCLQKAFSQPQPRLAEGQLLVGKGVKTAIDISDGLLADLGHICKASRTGAVIEVERLPIKDEVKSAFGAEALRMALSGGEDYQLLVHSQTGNNR